MRQFGLCWFQLFLSFLSRSLYFFYYVTLSLLRPQNVSLPLEFIRVTGLISVIYLQIFVVILNKLEFFYLIQLLPNHQSIQKDNHPLSEWVGYHFSKCVCRVSSYAVFYISVFSFSYYYYFEYFFVSIVATLYILILHFLTLLFYIYLTFLRSKMSYSFSKTTTFFVTFY